MYVQLLFAHLRSIVLTGVVGLLLIAMALLATHFGLKANSLASENEALKTQIRDLVERVADVEAALATVSTERAAIADVTLSTLNTVVDTTAINPEAQGKVYLATLRDQQDRTGPMPPLSAANYPVLVARIADIRQKATALAREIKDTSRIVGLRRDVLASIPSVLPARGWISSQYGIRSSPFHGGESMHRGIDIAAAEGTPVYATADGTVEFAAVHGGFGKSIRIAHGFGITTHYAHNASLLVAKGAKVRRGEQIAVVGSSGRSTGPHVHYEVHVHNQAVDPGRYLFDSQLPAQTWVPQLAQYGSVLPGVGGEPEGADEHDAGLTPGFAAAATDFTGERFFLAASLPGPLQQTTTTHMILFAVVLLMVTIGGVAVRGPAPAPRRRRAASRRLVAEPTGPIGYEWNAWARAQQSDDDGDDEE